MSAGYLRYTAQAALLLAATTLVACAVNSPPPPSGGGESTFNTIQTGSQSPESQDSSAADYDRMFLEIHADLVVELSKLEKAGKGGTRLAEIRSIVDTAEEFYLEGKSLVAIRLLTEAELLLRQSP